MLLTGRQEKPAPKPLRELNLDDLSREANHRRTPAVPANTRPSSAILDFLNSLPVGSIVAQLDDGSLAICRDEDEADRRILESREYDRRMTHAQYAVTARQ
jgi:hypothetical protein